MDKRIFQIGNFVAVVLTVLVNILATGLPLNDKTTGELSDAIPNLFVPAGITFAIWGVIYILLFMFAFYQARDLFSKDKIKMPYLPKITPYFIIASISNIAWIFLWHYQEVVLSLIPMILLFFSLLSIYLKLDIGVKDYSRNEKIFLTLLFSVYLGWITVATIANVTAVLVTIKWDAFGIEPWVWTILVLVVATLITLLMIFKRKDIPYSLVVIWALMGIAIKRMADDPDFGVQMEIAYTAIIGILVILIGIASMYLLKYLKPKKVKKKVK